MVPQDLALSSKAHTVLQGRVASDRGLVYATFAFPGAAQFSIRSKKLQHAARVQRQLEQKPV